jgi:3',5'-cyclic AMP phosphodiesterase CpdA
MIRWLHLSDVHENEDGGHPRRRMYDHILKAVKGRAEKPHLVFLTGDLAFKGTAAEYEKLNAGFIQPLKEALPEALFFAVPGNHDLLRDETDPPREWMEHKDRADLFHAASSGGAKRREKFLLPRFAPYAEFEKSFVKWSDQDWLKSETGAAVWRDKVEGKTVAVVGLNTAWLCQDDQDWGKLSAGRGLVERGFELAIEGGAPDLLFVLGHHPLEAMTNDQNDCGEELRKHLAAHNALYLHGHLHLTATKGTGSYTQNGMIIQAPSAFQDGDPKIWKSGLLWAATDGEKVVLEPHLLNTNAKPPEFVFDISADSQERRSGDRFVYPFPGKTAAPTAPTAPAEPAPAPVPPGWEIVDAAFLAREKSPAGDDQVAIFFDGTLPSWQLALHRAVAPRDIVGNLVTRLRNLLNSASRPGALLLTGAGGDGKSTAALHAAAQLVESGRWTCLRRRAAFAATPADLFNTLPRKENHGMLVLIDDADQGKAGILEALKHARTRTDVHLLLVARLADWESGGSPDGQWREAAEFQTETLKGLSQGEAERIVKGWNSLGGDAMGKLKGHSQQDAAQALLAHARTDAARPEEGALLGALLMTRYGEDLPQRVMKTVNALDRGKVAGVYSLRDVYLAIAAMHTQNQLYLTPRILAKALGCDENTLQTKALRKLRAEAMVDGGDANLLTRHRRIAEAAIKGLQEEGNEDPYRFLPLLAGAAQKIYFETKKDDAFTTIWTFGLAKHLAEQPGLGGTARAVAKAVCDADKHNPLLLTAYAQICRKTGKPEEAFPVMPAAADKFAHHRGVLYEWGTLAGAVGEHALGVWLAARSLADGQPAATDKNYKLSLAGLGVAFEALHQETPDKRFVEARAAGGQIGLLLPELNPTNQGYLKKHAAASPTRFAPESAVKAIRAAVIAAEELVERRDSDDGVEIDPFYFEKLLGDPAGYRFTALLRAVAAPRPKK